MDDSDTRVDALCARNLFDTPEGIFFFKDLDGRFIRVSKACAALTGRTTEQMVGLSDADLTDHDHAAALRDDEIRIARTGEPMMDKQEVDRLADRPGTWVETSKFALRDPDGTVIGTFGYSRDVTRWERAEQRLGRVESQLRAVLNASPDAIGHYDRDLQFLYANPSGERFKGRPLAELIGRTDRETGMPEEWLAVYESSLRRVLESGSPEVLEFAGDSDQVGPGSWFHVTLTPDRDATGCVVGVLSSVRDMTEVKKAQRAIKRLALHDPLTGLANRILLMDRLEAAIVALERHPAHLALFFVDVDYFKSVNDQHGHEVGDRVLIEVADVWSGPPAPRTPSRGMAAMSSSFCAVRWTWTRPAGSPIGSSTRSLRRCRPPTEPSTSRSASVRCSPTSRRSPRMRSSRGRMRRCTGRSWRAGVAPRSRSREGQHRDRVGARCLFRSIPDRATRWYFGGSLREATVERVSVYVSFDGKAVHHACGAGDPGQQHHDQP